MRALATFILALIISALPAFAAPVKVADIVRNPAAYLDQRLTVSGVIGSIAVDYDGAALCPTPEDRATLPAATAERPICIEMRLHEDQRKEIRIKLEKYRQAIVEITGLYWHRCLADLRAREPEVVREDCKDRGLNGYIGVESIAIRGYNADRNLTGLYPQTEGERDQLTELSPQSEEGLAIDKFVQAFLTAVRAKDADALALLAPKELRGFARIGFTVPETRLYWYVLSPEMAVRNESARRAGTGYRVYGGSRRATVCFCRRSNCAGAWPRSGNEFYTNLGSPTVCHFIERRQGTWWLAD